MLLLQEQRQFVWRVWFSESSEQFHVVSVYCSVIGRQLGCTIL